MNVSKCHVNQPQCIVHIPLSIFDDYHFHYSKEQYAIKNILCADADEKNASKRKR